jgi:hypothetical protein
MCAALEDGCGTECEKFGASESLQLVVGFETTDARGSV